MLIRSIITAATLVFVIAVVSPICSAQSGSRNAAPRPAAPAPTPSLNSPSLSPTQPELMTIPGSGQQTFTPFQDEFNNVPTLESGVTRLPSSSQQTTPTGSSAASNGGAVGVPAAEVNDDVWTIHDPTSNVFVDHSFFDCFLTKYVVTDTQGLNRVCYARVSKNDRNRLNCYLRYLQSLDVRTFNRDEQLAYWLNLYNARVISVILENYPVRSIRQIKSNFLDLLGPFDDEILCVLGKKLTLNDVESGIIRPIWKDPRIHFALNCASYGCPNLRKQAWRSENLSADLNAAAYRFINSNRAIRVGPFGYFVRVSKIFKWYGEDFGGTDAAILCYIRSYANAQTRHKLRRASKIKGYFYDWSLNDSRRVRCSLLERFIR